MATVATLRSITLQAEPTQDERLANVVGNATLRGVVLQSSITADEIRMQDVVATIRCVTLQFLPPRYIVTARSKQGRE